MALNITTVRQQFKEGVVVLTITKKSQINTYLGILETRNPRSFVAQPDPDPANHLNKGDKVTVTALLTPDEMRSCHPGIRIRIPDGRECSVYSTDIRHFLSL
jgi:hypothetical protein